MDRVQRFCVLVEAVGMFAMTMALMGLGRSHDYGDALTKSIMFFEGQRSGRLPSTQKMTWRKDSALRDGFEIGVDLVGGYYDAGDNVKYNFPMAFSTTMLAWGVLEFGDSMGADDRSQATDAIRWATDYFLKATSVPGLVFVQVGDPNGDHVCWERPEDMDTPRTPYAVSKEFPGSEVSAEIAAALASASIVFSSDDEAYSIRLLERAIMVFHFAVTNRGSYNDSLGPWVCPFYCDYNGYQDELIWGAAWLYKATKWPDYWSYVTEEINNLENSRDFGEFGWDDKHAGINILVSEIVLSTTSNLVPFVDYADKFVCSVLPESPTVTVSYSPGGLLFKPVGTNLQHTTALSFLLLAYANYLDASDRVVHCGKVTATPTRLVQFAKGQVDYILGSNPLNMSYMVGYGEKFPQRIHHRGSSIPAMDEHQAPIGCKDGNVYYESKDPNPNLLIGAVVGGPDIRDFYNDSRADFTHSEPTTYVNAPLVGLLAYFRSNQ